MLDALDERVSDSAEVVGGLLVSGAWIYLFLVLGPSLLSAAPYGKFSGSAATPAVVRLFLGWEMSSRLGWMLQAVASLLLSELSFFCLSESSKILQ
jgi:hypothetical protein